MKHIHIIATFATLSFIATSDAGLISHWTFDTDFTDTTATNHGTLIETGANASTIDTTTKVFGAGSFNSADNQDRVAISSTSLIADADGYTVSLWIKQSTSGTNGIAIGHSGSTNLIWKNNARYSFKANSAQSYFDLTGDTAWHHLVFVNNGTAAGSTLYIDNVAQTSQAGGVAPGALDANFTFDRLGAGYTKWGLVGNLDEVWIFDHALNATEINGLYEQNDSTYLSDNIDININLAITAPNARSIVQRDGNNLGSLPVSGTFTDAVDSIEARVVVMTGGTNSGQTSAWQTIDASPGGGTFSGTLSSIPAGGWYSLEVRAVTSGVSSPAISLDKVGVGDIYITAGQSNAASWGSPKGTVSDDRINRMTLFSGSWVKASDPMSAPNGLPGGGSKGSVWTRLGDLLVTHDNIPISFVSIAYGATTVVRWTPENTTHKYYNSRVKPAIQAFPLNGFRAILWHQGESDSATANSTSAADYQSRLTSIIDQTRIDAGWNIPWYVAEASSVGGTPYYACIDIQAAQRAVVFDDPNVFLGPSTNEFKLERKTSDGTHFNASGLLDHATQWRDFLNGITPIDIENHDFERNTTLSITGAAALSDGAFYNIDYNAKGAPCVLDWRDLLASGIARPDGTAGYFNPGTSHYTNASDSTNGGVMANMDGKHVAFLSDGSPGNYFQQYRRQALLPNHHYSLTVALGIRDNGNTFGGAKIELLANGQSLAHQTYTSADLDTLQGGSATGKFTDAQITFSTGSNVAANQPVGVQITKVNGAGTYIDIDNIRLTATPTAYGAWQIIHFGSVIAAAAGLDLDPDSDHQTNLYEFAFGSNPNSSSDTSHPVTFDGTKFTVTRRIGANANLTYTLQESSTLETGSWTTVTNTTSTQISISGDFETVEITKTSGAWASGTRNFLRIQIEHTP